MEDYPRTLGEFEARFSTEEACRDYLVRLRWPEGYACPQNHVQPFPTANLQLIYEHFATIWRQCPLPHSRCGASQSMVPFYSRPDSLQGVS